MDKPASFASMRAVSRPLTIVFLIVLCAGCGPTDEVGGGVAGGKNLDEMTGRPGDPRNGLRPSPWYDSVPDDYHRYTPEEVRKSVPDDDKKRNSPGFRGPLISPGFLQFVFWAFIAVLIAAVIYVLVQVILNNRGRGNAYRGNLQGSENRVVHGKIIAGVDVEEDVLSRASVALRIGEALRGGDSRRATVYVFIYALLLYSEREFLRLARYFTAREYTRTLRASAAPEEAKQLMIEISAAFEVAVYRQAIPDADPAELWRRLEAQAA